MINTIKNNKLLWLDYVAVAIIIIAFFVISYCGFFVSDDLAMAYGDFFSLWDVFDYTKDWYYQHGGRIFSITAQYFFCGLIGEKIWFDIVNTLFFLTLIVICGDLICGDKKNKMFYTLLFALSFWFLCPVPKETVFWVAGSTTHMWANTLAFAFIALYLKYKDDNFSFWGKLGLFLFSILSAAEFIPCVSICGAFVVYYLFHFKSLNKNSVPIVVGIVIGAIILLFAPGNFLRAQMVDHSSFFDRIKSLFLHPDEEIFKYKALWLFLFLFIIGWLKNKERINKWVKTNSFLLLSLGWSVLAFSVVFRPANRALFFPETLSLILVLKFIIDNYNDYFSITIKKLVPKNPSIVRYVWMSMMIIAFIIDSVFAVAETKKQSHNNDILLQQIVDNKGVVALDKMISSHRKAYVPSFPNWTWEPLAKRYGLDSVHIFPYYCQDKFYRKDPPFENLYVQEIIDAEDVYGSTIYGNYKKYALLRVRIKKECFYDKTDNHVSFIINYSRPRKWYKTWLDNLRNYKYDRTVIVEVDKPSDYYNDYYYYTIFFRKENAKNLKSVRFEVR